MSFLTENDDLLCGRVQFLILAVYALLLDGAEVQIAALSPMSSSKLWIAHSIT